MIEQLKPLVTTLQVVTRLHPLASDHVDAVVSAVTEEIREVCRKAGITFQDDFLSSMPTTIIVQIVEQTIYPLLKARRALDIATQFAGLDHRWCHLPIEIPSMAAYRFSDPK